jgi:predicted RND superfamily exporter protein
MNKLAGYIVKFRVIIFFVFIALMVISVFLFFRVKVNYDLSSYLPKDVPSTVAIEKMGEEFEQAVPNTEVGYPIKNLAEGLAMKEKLQSLDFVDEVLWMDDQLDLATPLELQDKKIVEGFLKGGIALFQLTISDDVDVQEALIELENVVGETGHIRGEVVEQSFMQRAVTSEMTMIVAVVIPAALIILLLSTTSWLEPILFMIVISAGVLINMGLNSFAPDVSFITQAVSSVLQLAVSMDYAIFLLHRFGEYRAEGIEPKEAMRQAIVKSFAPVNASALTTLFGFLALIFMRFGIGKDLGLVLARGVVVSLLTVFLLLPSLALLSYKLIDKTTHRSLIPSFKGFSRIVTRLAIPVVILALLLAVPSYIGQKSNNFLYGGRAYPKESRARIDADFLKENFGDNMQMALLVPRGEWATEQKLVKELKAQPEMKTVIGYANMVGTSVPVDLLPERVISPLVSENYSRIVLIADSPDESPETFELAERLRTIIDNFYPEGDTYLAGANVVLLDMKTTITQDMTIVNGLAVLAIFLVIMLTFKSLAIPIVLVLTIELAVWINLSVPYITGTPLVFIGYLVISTVQLGATVDYGILMTQHYLDHRQVMGRKDASMMTIQTVAGSIIPPALILSTAGYLLYFISSIQVVREIGHVLGRGALLSLMIVLIVLPNLLYVCDRVIEKTTWKLRMLPDRPSLSLEELIENEDA